MISVDRIESDVAVLETDEKNLVVPLSELPNGTKEGDVLFFEDGDYVIDYDETAKRKREILDLQDSLFSN